MNSAPSPLAHNGCGQAYRKNQLLSMAFLAALCFVLMITFLFALKAGSYETPVNELVKGIFGASSDSKINLVVRNNRLPRICTAMIAGAGLGLSGCIFQAVLRNPLASASTLGVSQGASFGAAAAIILFGFGASSRMGIPFCAFIGSIAVALMILGLSKFKQISPEGIVLSGVAISAMFTGATTLIQYFADEVQLASLVYWTFGDLGNTRWDDVTCMGIISGFLILYCFIHRWDYNALLSGKETAVSLGIHVQRLTLINMLLCCLASSIIVSNVGLINFIGLVAPHMVRMVIGNNHVYLIPGSALAGAVLLLLSDLCSRTIVSPVILPIGAITSFLGGPLFLYLLFKDGNQA
ncbi:MAG: iron ABC transporter permease [Lachnospiraceae bacterium]|jgi:iron complex transport system permease protein|nr:iron ABC transporter permease [Lachnospiraceae bacterium]